MTYELTLTDNLSISEELSNNIKIVISDSITLSVELDSVYKILRTGDTAFIRSSIY
jgi:hypothetical protein